MWRKPKQKRGWYPRMGLGAMLNGALREDLTKKVTFKSRSKRGESGPSNRLVKEGSRQRRWRCKGPEAGACPDDREAALERAGERMGLTLRSGQCRALRALGDTSVCSG